MLMFGMPSDTALLAAFGRVAIRHTQLDHVLRMTVKTIEGLTVQQGLDATRRQGSAALRTRIAKLAKARLREGPALVRLDAMLGRAERATDLRNALIHAVWAQELDGEETLMDGTNERLPIPTVADLDALALELVAVTNELNKARLEGFLHDALEAAKARTSPAPMAE